MQTMKLSSVLAFGCEVSCSFGWFRRRLWVEFVNTLYANDVNFGMMVHRYGLSFCIG